MYDIILLVVHLAGLLLLIVLLSTGLAIPSATQRTVSNHLTTQDKERFAKVFDEGLKSNDLQSLYYASVNVALPAGDAVSTCKRLLSLHRESKLNDFEKNFYLIGARKNFDCKETLPTQVESAVKAALTKDASTAQEIYYNFHSAKLADLTVDEKVRIVLGKNLQTVLKKDDSLNSLGHAFAVAAELGTAGSFAYDRIEEAFVQADEVDGRMLQFEGGLSITALVVNGGFKLATSLSKPLPITTEQAVKFATYFLSRVSVQTPKGVSLLLEALNLLASQKIIAPICIRLADNGKLLPESPVLNVRVCDLLGKPVSPAPVALSTTIVSRTNNDVLVSKVNLVPNKDDSTLFTYNLKPASPTRGLYHVDIEVAPSYKQQLQVSVLGKVRVSSLEVGVGDTDSAASSVKRHSITHPSKLAIVLNADSQQKVLLKTALVDDVSGKPINVHQAFVLLRHMQTRQEIIFVAETDSSKAYKFEMDVGARASDFRYKSGLYELCMIIGDTLLSNSFRWHVADLELKFSVNERQQKSGSADAANSRKLLPEIVHQFRTPEKRPARFVSDLFTVLCIAPIVILFGLWARLGVNVKNFPLSLGALGFHLGLGAILVLFAIFWLRLNMFETIRYLIPLALFTFFCGNRMLRKIARGGSEK
ncbi:dolichyl-diphosphooligosaccharide--protein glycosyltransferase subunit 2 [Anopheles maculipalpis]|uniref:dolichyl-diphosphooligosaccharide--protein glycosyltransferase subunit 2 n=1 Tax=Anopheles maculipalpis TaxID=1496333 RepID=UPI0021597E89|nr:dolichyl-diphosphooligosaccharide--protein glycosyltransferase subunit 2 [Anopheles maculipalpis]